MKFNYSLSLFLSFVTLFVEAQVMPSADASAMVRNMDIPVNLYNGVASVSVPITDAGGVPVGLQYNTSGIRVDQQASSVGLGWQLAAGGAITRVVNGRPDELSLNSDEITNPNFPMLRGMVEGTDYEKDVYYFSFPGGGGKFLLDVDYLQVTDPDYEERDPYDYGSPYYQQVRYINVKTITPRLFPDQDIEIELISDQLGWKIYDGAGNIYVFGNNPSAQEVTTTLTSYDGEPDRANEISYISTWYLTEIISASTGPDRSIKFHYTNGYGSTTRNNNLSYSFSFDCDNQLINEELNTTQTSSYVSNRNLTRITFPTGNIVFKYAMDRMDDSRGRRLTQILKNDLSLNEVERYDFEHGYFNANDSYYKGAKLSNRLGYCNEPSCYRLRLDAIRRVAGHRVITLREFEYNSDQEFDPVNGYDLYELPPRYSKYQDHWGYNNSGPWHGETYESFPSTEFSGPNSYRSYQGMDKSGRISSIAGMLTKVISPAGGFSRLVYSNHSSGGGVKIDSLLIYNEKAELIGGTYYQYMEQETIGEDPVYFEVTGFNSLECADFSPEEANYTITDIFKLYSSVQNAFVDQNGTSVGYSKVIESDLFELGTVEHYFLNFSDREEPVGKRHIYEIDFNKEQKDHKGELNDEQAPFSPRNQQYYDRGVEYQTIVKNSNQQLVSESYTEYTKNTPVSYTCNNWSLLDVDYYRSYKEARVTVANYSWVSRPVRVEYQTNTIYEGGNSMTTRTDFYYGKFIAIPDLTITTMPDGRKIKTYATHSEDLRVSEPTIQNDLGETEALWGIKNQYGANLLPVESVTLQKFPGEENYSVISASFGTLKEIVVGSDTLFNPYKSYSLQLEEPLPEVDFSRLRTDHAGDEFQWDSRYRLISTVKEYDQFGNPLTVIGADGITTKTVYDENGNYPIRSEANELSTSYTYKELVGMVTSTDPNGRTTTYEYDPFNRLKLVKNHEGNIMKHHEYNYLNETKNLNPNFKISGLPKVGSRITIELVGELEPETEVTWDLGNGTVVTNNEKSISTYYNGVGVYVVSVSLKNLSYGTNQASGSLQIHSTEAEYEMCASATIFEACKPKGDQFSASSGCGKDAEAFAFSVTGMLDGAVCLGEITYDWFLESPGSYGNSFYIGSGITLKLSSGDYLNAGDYTLECRISSSCGDEVVFKNFEVIALGCQE